MDINDIPVKSNRVPVTDTKYQLSAEEFNAIVGSLKDLRNLLSSEHQYQVVMKNNLSSNNISVSAGKPCELKFTFISQERTGFNPWTDTGETGDCKVSIKNSLYPNFTVIKNYSPLSSNTPITLDVAEYLTAGVNQIVVTTSGDISGVTTPALIYTAVLTSLSISADNFAWWNAYASDFKIPYVIEGNISKTLVVSVSGSGYNKSYEVDLGNDVYTEAPYNYTVLHPKRTGVFKVSAYLRNTDGTIRTEPVSFNVICYMQGATTKLMAVNNVAESLENWNESRVFDYTIFEGDSASSAATFKVTKDGRVVFTRTEAVIATKTKHTFTIPLEIETIDDLDFNAVISALSDDKALIDPITIKVSNSRGFSPSAGATLYINPRTRSNNELDRDKLLNEVDGTYIQPTWRNMNWWNDGYTLDEQGNSIMRIMAGSLCDTNIVLLKPEPARTGMLFEIEYKISNVTDYSVPIIDCSESHMGSFTGFKVYPDKVVLNSSSLKTEENQSFRFNTEDRIHLAIAIMPDIYGNTDFNVCVLYINGVKNREFTYASNDYFLVNNTLKIGSDNADIDLYGIRLYSNALSSDGVIKNWVNWRSDNEEKKKAQDHNNVYNAAGTSIDFDKVRNLCNVVVFEGDIPSYSNPNKFRTNAHIYWRDNPEWNVDIFNVPLDGQGTSSKFYWLWNLRWKCDGDTLIVYADGTEDKKKFIFVPGFPKVSKVTWKLNWASSCQCNKMGSVNSINDMAELLDCLNEIKSRVSIYQYPFVGFQLQYNEEGDAVYTFLGLYTGGPDKSDSGTMGLDTDTYPELLFVEGADNASEGALFKVPWNPSKPYWKYNADEESMQYNGKNAWDYDGGKPESQAEVQALYEKVWMPAYNFVYQCSPNLTYWDGTIDELNSAENILRYKTLDTEFWLENGDVYYYEAAEGKFIPSDIGNGTINLYTQLVDKGYGPTSDNIVGKTKAELSAMFSVARSNKFAQEAPGFFNKKASIFARNWIEFNAGSDNRTKNTYFISLGPVSEGYRFHLFHDDTDTIGPWTNQGQDKKGYWVEVGDKYENGLPVWNGEQNRFFNLMETAWAEDIKNEMRAFMNTMVELSGSSTGTFSNKLYAFYHRYYFAKAQEYFPKALYNMAAKVLYETGKLAQLRGVYENDTDPLSQSMGDYYSGWKRWITYRIQYMQSKYSHGDYSASGTGHIIVRAAGNNIIYNITPAIWMYPCIATGTSIVRGERTEAGKVCTMAITLGDSADQQNQIKGAHYLQSIGGWWDKNVTGTLTIVGRMLRELLIGHPTEEIVISISKMEISNTPSLQYVDVRRVATLSGVLNLSSCSHLKEVYASGSGVTQISLPPGGPLQHVEFSEANQYIILRNFPLLKESGVVMDACMPVVSDFLIENCDAIDSIALLRKIMTAQAGQTNHALKKIRAVGFEATYEGTTGSKVLKDLATLADGSYEGLDSNGLAGSNPLPVLDGLITINSNYPPSAVATLNKNFPNLELILNGIAVLEFNDDEFKRIALTLWDADSDGDITPEEGQTRKLVHTAFAGNTTLVEADFSELNFYVPYASTSVFKNCTGLKKIVFGKYGGISSGDLQGCSSLETVVFPDDLSNYEIQQNGNGTNWGYVFKDCTSLKRVDFLPKVNVNPIANSVANDCFYGCSSLEYIDVPESFNYLFEKGFGSFIRDCVNLKTAIFRPTTYTTFSGNCCSNTPLLESLVIFNPTPSTVGWGSLPSNGTCMIYVPDESVTAYKTASGWSAHADRIKGISEYPGTL